ncbi:hypothetical protein TELCIR_05413 [Teladorsagia circumcincta]|uniref:Uncharacterized protein n=1 Tax=Teladorsagia circumcincta TaxID=45464 RepID=A0A2G9UQT8_TELCI|nr:hypothetical protein TELCIR_05413 [Teladorsagia circumcincta]
MCQYRQKGANKLLVIQRVPEPKWERSTDCMTDAPALTLFHHIRGNQLIKPRKTLDLAYMASLGLYEVCSARH